MLMDITVWRKKKVILVAKSDKQFRGHWFGLFLPKLSDTVQWNETSCLPRVNPFQYDTEHRQGRKDTKHKTKQKTRKQNIKETDTEDADIWTRQDLKLSTEKNTKFFSVPRGRINSPSQRCTSCGSGWNNITQLLLQLASQRLIPQPPGVICTVKIHFPSTYDSTL
jgi:hypothetical protein